MGQKSALPLVLRELRSKIQDDGGSSDLRPRVELETVGPVTTMINVLEIAEFT